MMSSELSPALVVSALSHSNSCGLAEVVRKSERSRDEVKNDIFHGSGAKKLHAACASRDVGDAVHRWLQGHHGKRSEASTLRIKDHKTSENDEQPEETAKEEHELPDKDYRSRELHAVDGRAARSARVSPRTFCATKISDRARRVVTASMAVNV